MEKIYHILLALHIVSGTSSLVFGFLALLFKKGSPAHKRTGKIFFFSMVGVCLSAWLISGMKGNRFLFSIGIFSFYQLFAGYRSIKNKSLKPVGYEWVLLGIGTLNALQMLGSGKIVLIIFGSISAIQMISEYKIFRKASTLGMAKNDWLKRHIGMMMGSYIATFTAFLVVNISDFRPGWLLWILPTLVGVPIIVLFTRKFTNPKRA